MRYVLGIDGSYETNTNTIISGGSVAQNGDELWCLKGVYSYRNGCYAIRFFYAAHLRIFHPEYEEWQDYRYFYTELGSNIEQ